MKQTSDKSEQAMSEIIIEAHTSMIKLSAKSEAWLQF
jgi:hypothetical protein